MPNRTSSIENRKSLDHIGIAVLDAERVAAMYRDVLGYTIYKTETVETQGVETWFMDAGGAKLELLTSTQAGSTIERFLEKRGEGLHHIAFEVEDLKAEMARLQQLGYELLTDAPQPGADGKWITFLHPKQTHGVLIELCQSRSESEETPS